MNRASRDGPAAAGVRGTGGVLVAHPGAELYGSDRMVLDSVAALSAAGYSVTVALPERGPLVGKLEAAGARVVPCRMPVLRKSALRPRGFLRLVAERLRDLSRPCA